MNLPVINWTDVSIKRNHVSPAINLKFLDTLQDYGLEQMVTFPTLLDNTGHKSIKPTKSRQPMHLHTGFIRSRCSFC